MVIERVARVIQKGLFMNELLPYIAFCHNSQLVTKAERILNNMLEDGNAIIYITNNDGTNLKLNHGCKIIFAQIWGKND